MIILLFHDVNQALLLPAAGLPRGVIFAFLLIMAELPEDIALYEQQTKAAVTDPFPYNRLMIYYRKQKDYKKELQLINHALKVFGDQLKKQTSQLFATAKSRTTLKRLSDKFNKSSGLTDNKGNPAYLPEPLAGWTKRKQTVQQKLKK